MYPAVTGKGHVEQQHIRLAAEEQLRTLDGGADGDHFIRVDSLVAFLTKNLLHELLHISPRFDGTLDPERRHSRLGEGRFEALLRPLLRRYLADGDASLLGGLGHHGDVLARQWLERPTPRSTARQTYTEKHLFLGPITMITRRKLHS